METSLSTTQTKELSFLNNEKIKKYQEVDKCVNELFEARLSGISFTKAKVVVVKKIESILDEEFLTEIMSFQGKPYGFKVDSKSGYPKETVKDCVVQAMLFGAEVTGNEINILGGNMYLTKEYCENSLIKNKVWNRITLGFSKQIENGTWVIPTKIEWVDPRDEKPTKQSENLDIPVNKFSNTTKEDTLRGAAKRDALYWLIGTLRGMPMPFGEMTSTIEVQPTTTTAATPKPIVEKPQVKVEHEEATIVVDEKIIPCTPKQQEQFDKFICKAISKVNLEERAKQCYTNCKLVLQSFNLDVYNSLMKFYHDDIENS
jgi:hypothetical protein